MLIRTITEVSEEAAMVDRWFFKKICKSCLLILVAMRGLIGTLFQSLKILSMIVFDAEPKVLETEIFLQHTIVNLNSGIKFVLFSQEKLLQ